MNTLKRIAGALGVALLPILFFTFGSLVSTYLVLGSPNPIKKAIDQSGLYDVAISQALGSALQDAGQASSSDSVTNNPEIQKVITDALPAEDVKQKAEGVIDSTYGWLQGNSKNLDFAIDLKDTKTKIADGMARYTQERLSKLPQCADGNTTALTNPLEATCVPSGFDASIAGQQVKDEIVNSQDFLKDSQVTADSLKSADGKTIDQQLHAMPVAYEQVKWGMYITGALTLAAIAASVFCAHDLRAGLKRTGIIAVVVGAVSVLIAWVAGKVLHVLTDKLAEPASDAQLQSKLLDALQILTQDMRNWWIAYGLVLIGLGSAALVVAIRFMKANGAALASGLAQEANAPPAPPPADNPGYRRGPKIQ